MGQMYLMFYARVLDYTRLLIINFSISCDPHRSTASTRTGRELARIRRRHVYMKHVLRTYTLLVLAERQTKVTAFVFQMKCMVI